MPSQLTTLLLLAFRALCASAAPPPAGFQGPPGGDGPAQMAPAMPPTLSVGGWPTSTDAGWMNASPWTSSVTTSAASRVSSAATTTSATQSAFSTTVSYSNGTTRSLASCAASLNGTVPSSPGFNFSGTVRRYYVAAEEIEWNYAPSGWDNWLGVSQDGLSISCKILIPARQVPLNDSSRARNAGYLQYGTVWTKALYRGYTDATFTQRTEQPAYQGTQGMR
jgi:hypothetical protein